MAPLIAASHLRNAFFGAFRALPRFPGKAHIGNWLLHSAFAASRSDRPMVTIRMRSGGRMRLDVRSRTEVWAFVSGAYEPRSVALMCRLLPDHGVALDVGANVGLVTIPLGLWARKCDGCIHAFEPVHDNFRRLIENIALNGLGDTVVTHKLALGDMCRTAEMHREGHSTASAGDAVVASGKIVEENGLHPTDTVAMVTLDAWNQEAGLRRCDLIKMDVEGYEHAVLCGASEFLRRYRPIIVGEFNRYFLGQFGRTFADVGDLLGPLRYRPYALTRSGPKLANWVAGLQDVALVPEERDLSPGFARTGSV